MDGTQAQGFFEALLAEDRELGVPREVARHLAYLALNELSGFGALHPQVQALATALLTACAEKNIYLVVGSTFRSVREQNSLFAQGRSTPGAIVTDAMGLESYHQYGLAFDVRVMGKNSYPDDAHLWETIGGIGEALGLVWGGRFGDNPHFEYHPGFDWHALQAYFIDDK